MTTPPGQPTTPPEMKPKGPRHQLDEEGFRRYSRLLGWLVLAIIVSYGAFQLPLPWRVLTIIAGAAGVIGGVVLLVQCLRKKLPVMAHVSAVLVIGCCGMFATLGAAQAVFWNATVAFDECRETAVTERAMTQCYSEYEQDMFSTLPGMG